MKIFQKPGKFQVIAFDICGVLLQDGLQVFLRHISASTRIPLPQLDHIFRTGEAGTRLYSGDITLDNYWELVSARIKKRFGKDLFESREREEMAQLWFEAYTLRPEIKFLMKQLREMGYLVVTLSNCFHERTEFFRNRYVHDQYSDLNILSYEHGMAKPERLLFKKALELTGTCMCPDNFLFIDDRPDYQQGAIEVGIPTIRYREKDFFVTLGNCLNKNIHKETTSLLASDYLKTGTPKYENEQVLISIQ